MQAFADLGHAEQHDAEEAGLQEEGGEHFIGHQRPDHRPCLCRENRPVRAELIRHDDARYDAHGESDGKDLHPVAEQVEIDVPSGFQPQSFQDHQIAGKAD